MHYCMVFFYCPFWRVLWRFKSVSVSVVLLSMIKPFPLLWRVLWRYMVAWKVVPVVDRKPKANLTHCKPF